MWRKAQLELAEQENPEAREEAKRMGLAVGKRVRYHVDMTEHIGVVVKVQQKSIEVVMTGEALGGKWAKMIVRRDTIPYSGIREVLGDGVLPEPEVPPEPKKWPAPPAIRGYEECDIGRCAKRPVMAYMVRKYDKQIGELGPPHIVAVCREHDEKYEEARDPNKGGIYQTPPHIPALWQLGVVFDSWRVLQPVDVENANAVSQAIEKVPADRRNSKSVAGSPYEGVKGRHPRLCDCSKHMLPKV